MKTKLLLLVLLFAGIAKAQNVNIPDSNFKQYLLSANSTNAIAKNTLDQNIKIDFNNDGEIQVSEAIAVHKLVISAPGITDVTGINSFSNLFEIGCSAPDLTILDLTGLNLLDNIFVDSINIASINLNSLFNLHTIYIQFCNNLNSINMSGLVNLQEFNCTRCDLLPMLDVSSLVSLKKLNLSGNYGLTSLNVSNCINLEDLVCNVGFLNSLVLNGATKLKRVVCSTNNLSELNINGLVDLEILICRDQKENGSIGISNLDFTGLTKLKALSCDNNNLSVLDIAHLTFLEDLFCSNNLLTNLDIANLTNLKRFSCGNNFFTNLDINLLTNLTYLRCERNLLTSLNIGNLINLTDLNYGFNQIGNMNFAPFNFLTDLDCSATGTSVLNISNLTQLKSLTSFNNSISLLQLSTQPNLESLICFNNSLTNLDLTTNTKLSTILVAGNLFTNLDFSTCSYLSPIPYNNNFQYDVSDNPNLRYLNLKNGKISYPTYNLTAFNCPLLNYVCADDYNLSSVKGALWASESYTTQVSSYCTFTPGGSYNTISGNILFDANNNGCDTSDLPRTNIKVSINDGTNQGSSFTSLNGNYSFYTAAGSFVLTPEIENPTWFNFAPSAATINFADTNSNITNQDFCITANGVHNDLEVVIYPISDAIPGFDATYKVVYKNKGNQTISGDIALTYDDAVLDYVSATVPVTNNVFGQLTWAYSGIQPFETKSFELTLNLNSSTETPPLNSSDVLTLTTAITPIITDENDSDNVFTYTQYINNSFSQNDIVCTEGDNLGATEIGKYLHYLVNFENTGNATVQNVVVRTEIDASQFNIGSIQLLNSSHNATTRVNGNIVEFIFENINLNAAQPGNPVGGHGNVLFKIKTLSSLTSGSTVNKSADIYFDYNAPVSTGIAETTFANLRNSVFLKDDSILVFPNPTNSVVNINSTTKILTIELYDVQGRILETLVGNNRKLDISDKTNGIYFLKITTEKGSKVERIIKE